MYNVALMNYFYNVETKDYEKAYKILKDLESFLKEKDKKSLSRIYEHLMEINFLLNKQEEAYSYQKKYIKNIEINFNERTANITNIYFSKQEKLKLIKEKKELNKILKNKNEEIAVIKIEESEINNLLKNNFIIVVLLIFFVFIMIALYIKYNKISNKDVLTNLYNRRFIKKSYKRLNIKNAEISFILIDLDYFKLINDNYGHEIGDKVIKEIAIIMNKETRSGDVLSRICGEEFLVLTKNNKKKAQNIAERLRSSIENHDFYFIEEKIKLTASFGISTSINKEKKYQKCTLNQIKIYINQNLAVGIK
jgi:diguanylate cyclase (GGDEF)-like protein